MLPCRGRGDHSTVAPSILAPEEEIRAPHATPLLPHSLTCPSCSLSHFLPQPGTPAAGGRARRSASPSIQSLPIKSKSTRNFAVSPPPSPCEESRNGARTRPHRALPLLLRPPPSREAQEPLRPPLSAIVASLISPCSALTHEPFLLPRKRRSRRRRRPRRAPCLAPFFPANQEEEDGPYPFARACGPLAGPAQHCVAQIQPDPAR